MGIVIVGGLGMAALKIATVFWTNAAATLVLLLLLTGVAGAIFSRGDDRAYWSGFALFGWVYLGLVNWTWLSGQLGYDLTSSFGDFAERAVAVETTPTVITPTDSNLSR